MLLYDASSTNINGSCMATEICMPRMCNTRMLAGCVANESEEFGQKLQKPPGSCFLESCSHSWHYRLQPSCYSVFKYLVLSTTSQLQDSLFTHFKRHAAYRVADMLAFTSRRFEAQGVLRRRSQPAHMQSSHKRCDRSDRTPLVLPRSPAVRAFGKPP